MPSQLNILGPLEASSAGTTEAGRGTAAGEEPLAGWLAGCRRGLPPHAPSGRAPGDGLAGLAPLQRPPAEGRRRLTRPAPAVSVRKRSPREAKKSRLLLAASAERRPVDAASLHAAGSRRGHAAEAGREGRAAAAPSERGGRCLRAALQEMGRRRKSAAPGRRRPFSSVSEAAPGGAMLRRGATRRRHSAPWRPRRGFAPGRHFIPLLTSL